MEEFIIGLILAHTYDYKMLNKENKVEREHIKLMTSELISILMNFSSKFDPTDVIKSFKENK